MHISYCNVFNALKSQLNMQTGEISKYWRTSDIVFEKLPCNELVSLGQNFIGEGLISHEI